MRKIFYHVLLSQDSDSFGEAAEYRTQIPGHSALVQNWLYHVTPG